MVKRQKVALIGPIYPYRGGIAQYNKELRDALENQAELTTYSFKRLYPSFLYPGKSDKEEGVKGWLQGVRYVLDAYSPFSVRRAAHKLLLMAMRRL
uniref:CAZy families GT4 protein n=1 Tax=uncultured Methanococcus sp. TaxID=262498 RepID=A0A060C8I3_9EURY|nr:CAZy families GT4 protein [uncultured Methanococcus sp.]